MTAYRHEDMYTRDGVGFIVQVSRHSVERSEGQARFEQETGCFDIDGPHRWCVYAYIYPHHWHFAAFSGSGIYQDAAAMMPLHGGPSLLRWHWNEKGEQPTSVQIGCDYSHLHDGRYSRMATADDARSVFSDADELFNWLSREVQQ